MTTLLLSRLSCYLSGHDYTIRQSGGRMFLYCPVCEHRSDGIVLTGRSDASPRDAQNSNGRYAAGNLTTN